MPLNISSSLNVFKNLPSPTRSVSAPESLSVPEPVKMPTPEQKKANFASQLKGKQVDDLTSAKVQQQIEGFIDEASPEDMLQTSRGLKGLFSGLSDLTGLKLPESISDITEGTKKIVSRLKEMVEAFDEIDFEKLYETLEAISDEQRLLPVGVDYEAGGFEAILEAMGIETEGVSHEELREELLKLLQDPGVEQQGSGVEQQPEKAGA